MGEVPDSHFGWCCVEVGVGGLWVAGYGRRKGRAKVGRRKKEARVRLEA